MNINLNNESGVSPVIGVVLMVAIVVALVALVTVVVFNLNTNVGESPDATVDIEETDVGIKASVIRNENVKSFRIEHESGANKTLDGDPSSSTELREGNGGYDIICIFPDGSELVLDSTEATGAESGFRTISGEVSGSSIEGAKVEAIGSEETVLSTTTTDSNGNYTIEIIESRVTDIRVNFNENNGAIVSGASGTTVAGAGVKQVNSQNTIDFKFNSTNGDIVSGLDINGVNEVRYLNSDDGVREIANVYQLQAMNESVSSDYELVSDIDASGTDSWNGGKGFEPVAAGSDQDPFSGTFNGQNHSINGLVIDRSNKIDVGLFGQTNTSSNIRNIRLTDVDITGDQFTGALAGRNNGPLENIYVSGTVSGRQTTGGIIGMNDNGGTATDLVSMVSVVDTSSNTGGVIADNYGNVSDSYAGGDLSNNSDTSRIGGLIGSNSGLVNNSYATVDVNGEDQVGGLIGYNGGPFGDEGVTVKNSYATGDVSGTDEAIGGLIGRNYDDVSTSYSTGSVSSTGSMVGGFVGDHQFETISNSYTTSDVTGGNQTGGFVGLNGNKISNSYAVGSVSGDSNVGGFAGQNGEEGIDGFGSASNGTIESSYWNSEINNELSGIGKEGGDDVNGNPGGESIVNSPFNGLSTDDMQGSSAESNMNGLDFSNVWTTDSDDYPDLQ